MQRLSNNRVVFGIITFAIVFLFGAKVARSKMEDPIAPDCGESLETRPPGQSASRTTLLQATRVSGPAPGKTWQVPVLGMELAFVGPGSFQMGSDDGDSDEKPIHMVCISQGYWISKYEVTQQQYKFIMGSNPSKFRGSNNPVETASWKDSVSFCRKLTDLERRAGRMPKGYEYRLPTEAEWEYAARGGGCGRSTKYAGSKCIGDVAWYQGNSGAKMHPVGQKQANELGLHDMSGNAYEWCLDWKCGYSSGSQTNPAGPSMGLFRVFRGGGWFSFASICRVTNRSSVIPSFTDYTIGFRVALAPELVDGALRHFPDCGGS